MVTKKRKIDFTDESVRELMQETYHEIVDERQRALVAYKKYTKDLDEKADIAMIGKVTIDLLKIVDGSIEKKLRLLKLQTDVLYKNGKGKGEEDAGASGAGLKITDEDRKAIQEMLNKNSLSDEPTNVKKYG